MVEVDMWSMINRRPVVELQVWEELQAMAHWWQQEEEEIAGATGRGALVVATARGGRLKSEVAAGSTCE
jgi:hypothetical protein